MYHILWIVPLAIIIVYGYKRWKENKMKMQKGDKTCPECQSKIPAAAFKCAHCGHSFRDRDLQHPVVLILVIILVVWMIAGIVSMFSATSENNVNNSSPKEILLNARISKDNLTINIYNDDKVTWRNCLVRLNYDYKAGYNLKPGKNSVPYENLTKNNGTRFNYYTTDPQSISITCEEPEASYYAGW